MPKTVAVTHANLAPSRKSTELGSKTGVVFIVFTVICGLFCFILCLIAKSLVAQEKWVETEDDGKGVRYQCVYSGSGKTPLLCSAVAFVGLAAVMLVEHMYMLIAVSKSPAAAGLVSWDIDSARFKSLTWQDAFFFVTTWAKRGIGTFEQTGRDQETVVSLSEKVVLCGWSVDIDHCFPGGWLIPNRITRPKIVPTTPRQQVLETSVLYGSPPHRLTTMARENPVITELPNRPPRFSFSGDFGKKSHSRFLDCSSEWGPEFAEIYAMLIALKVFLEAGCSSLTPLIVESDCQVVLNWLTFPLLRPWKWWCVLEEIDSISKSFASIKVIYEPRSHKGMADHLAKEGMFRQDLFKAWCKPLCRDYSVPTTLDSDVLSALLLTMLFLFTCYGSQAEEWPRERWPACERDPLTARKLRCVAGVGVGFTSLGVVEKEWERRVTGEVLGRLSRLRASIGRVVKVAVVVVRSSSWWPASGGRRAAAEAKR
ncbi:Far1-related sequence 11 isoform 1 [Hibiscus syriacus]|uniref:Far1-related sequence 11 isoform 1 n=1 Tax=Hibiscus syriacus TaxID=106335 RepID=A0A6A3D361_HIBSY|nr:Far1-related sequence 11 isoform 1 [Hibiscus syriacus]